MKRLLRYLIGTKDHGVRLAVGDASPLEHIDVMVDSDWAGQRSDRRSVSGLQDCLMAGWSRTQHQVAQSSAEAELYAIIEGCNEALGL
eukprot:13291185-Alexandrium_andersonii.AAC.1